MAIPYGIIRKDNFVSIYNWFSGTNGNVDLDVDEIFKSSPGQKIKIKSISFQGSVKQNYIVVKEGDENGPIICRLGSVSAYETDRCYFKGGAGSYMKPFLDVSAAVLAGVPATNNITFEFI